jgi:hypothetical protein
MTPFGEVDCEGQSPIRTSNRVRPEQGAVAANHVVVEESYVAKRRGFRPHVMLTVS